MQYISVQLRKLFGRSDIRISLVAFSVLPILLAYLASLNSGIMDVGQSMLAGISYTGLIINILKGVFLLYVLLTIFTTSFIAGEIDSGTENMYIAKAQSRISLVVSKLAALYITTLAIFATIMASSVIGWFLFLRTGKNGEPGYFSVYSVLNQVMVFTIVLTIFEMLFMVSMFSLISLYFTQSKALVFSFVAMVGLRLLASWKQVRYFIPSYIGTADLLDDLQGKALTQQGLIGLTIILTYIIAFSLASIARYKKMDFIR